MSGRKVPEWLNDARTKWANTGADRPPFAHTPGPGQESVWDYPRPPALVADQREVVVGPPDTSPNAAALARTTSAIRICETASPPTFYLPPADVDFSQLVESGASASFCEWKGPARYWVLAAPAGDGAAGSDEIIAWDYPNPFEEYSAVAGYVSFYPGRIPCTVDGERVRPQPGGFYGGWITNEIVGPVKGEAGTGGW